MTLMLALLPACDFTIRDATDWAHVNDADKQVICVAPAPTYTYEQVGVVQLTASGTPERPRWLRWTNEDESLHPARVPEAETAAVSQFDVRGNHWVIDRLVVRDAIAQPRVMGSGNTLQRMVFERPRAWEGRPGGLMLHFTNGSDNAVVDSVFREPLRMPGKDSYAVYIHHAERVTVQGNEFIDMVNGVQNGPEAGGGHRIVANEFYHTPASYTDCRGRPDPAGKCSCSEGMAFVAKGPADKPESFLEGNLVWGFQKSDPVCAGTGAPGTVFNFGSTSASALAPAVTRHFTVRDNVIIARIPHAIYLGARVDDLTIAGNYVANAGFGIVNSYGRRITIVDNVFRNNRKNYLTSAEARGTVYENNRSAGTGEKCFVARHLTDPRPLCIPW